MTYSNPPMGDALKTAIGPTLEPHGSFWTLDLTHLPIFHGLSVISQALGDMVIDQAKNDRVDINVERAVWARENPELVRDLGVVLVKVTAEHETVATLVRGPELFHDQFRAVFGTLQRHRYRAALFPPNNGVPPVAVAFRFFCLSATEPARDSGDHIFVLERVASSRNEGQCYLRITIEDPGRPRLALDAIPHLVVDDLHRRTFIAGSTRIAETWTEGLRREAERGHRSFVEKRTSQSHLFKQFRKAGLHAYDRVSITWTDASVDRILDSDPIDLRDVLKRMLLALEDHSTREVLRARELVRVVCEDMTVYLDESELGRVLNLSLDRPRERLDLDEFLDRMPQTASVVDAAVDGALAGVHVFLIHHITAEILGLIAALRRLGCRDLTTLLVAYAGEAPSGYLGPLLELPPDEFRCLALVNVPDDESVEGHYRLSAQYSELDTAEELGARLSRKRMTFFEAMQTVAAVEFMRLVARAEKAAGRCLILEDGGYLAPAISRACLDGHTIAEFLAVSPMPPADRLVRDRLDPLLIGSVEHTRNGMNRLLAVTQKHGRLAFPAFTIAVSRCKIEVEAREVAATVLNAVENVLHAMGRVLSRRRCVVLGSRGAIGGHLMRGLRARLNSPDEQLAGVDLKASEPATTFTSSETTLYRGLPRPCRLGVDLVLGVTGESVLHGEDLQEWLLFGEPAELILASGSTKTEEFRDLAAWVDGLLTVGAPRVGGRPAAISVREVKDPITNRLYSHRYRFDLEMEYGRRRRDVVFLANLTPVNFMFYGVPTEVIDEVLAEFLGSGLGLVRRTEIEALPATLQIVDRDITAFGDPM